MSRLRFPLLVIVGLLILVVAWQSSFRGLQAQEQPQFQQHAYVDPTSIWPTHGVYVCWENPDPHYQKEMALVRNAVAASWEAASDLHFTGWQKCSEQNRGIRILIDDSGPRAMALGRYLDGMP